VERGDLGGRELDIAGAELTSQNDLLARLSRITGRSVHSVPVPDFLATFGAKAISLMGWDVPLNEGQVTMLNEGSTIPAGGVNALTEVLGVAPTPLDTGLRQLADVQPEQLPSVGVGALKRKRYWSDIHSCRLSPEELFAHFRANFNEVTPVFVDAGAEPAVSDQIDEGETLTLALPMRGHVQVRIVEVTPRSATCLTVDGHPLAGAVRFACERVNDAVRFEVEVFERAANVLDLIAMRTLGDRLQDHTWEQVVERMVERSAGRAPEGVQRKSESLDDAEAKRVEQWVEKLVLHRKRAENAEKITS
jgi:NADH dehydrogenase